MGADMLLMKCMMESDAFELTNQLLNSIFEVINKNIDKMNFIFDDIDVSANANYAIRYAAENGYADIVKLLLKDKRVDPAAGYNYAIRYAAANDHYDVVKLLLKDKRVDPSANDNEIIKKLLRRGSSKDIKLIELVFSDERVKLLLPPEYRDDIEKLLDEYDPLK